MFIIYSLKKTNTAKETMVFIDKICDWFKHRTRFWTAMSVFALVSILLLGIFLSPARQINLQIRYTACFVMIPLLILFVLGMFWRGSVQTFLSLAGMINVYTGMFFVYAMASSIGTLPPIVTNRLGVGKIVESSSASSLANFYFLVGILALVLCLVISLKPSLWRAKGTRISSSYPIWTGEKEAELEFGSTTITLIPVKALLSFGEKHLVAKYKFVVVRIGGRTYFVSPDGWIPEGSDVVRDADSGSVLGIPKVPDPFNP